MPAAPGQGGGTPLDVHSLLEEQLKLAARDTSDGAVDYAKLLEMVSAAYEEADLDRTRKQRALGLVSDELSTLGQRMRDDAVAKLRDSEAQFRAIANNSPTKIHIKDTKGRYLLVNKVAEQLFGVTDADARGKTARDLFPTDLADEFEDHDRQVLESGRVIEQEEYWELPDGTHTFLTFKFPIFDDAGKLLALGAIGTDITDRKRSEQELRISKEQAELANRSKSEFLANMSHELRTPLNAIIGFSEMILNRLHGPVGDAKYLEYAEDINRSGVHLLELISDILDLSKVEAGKVELAEEPLDVVAAVEGCLTLVRERAFQGSVELTRDFADDLPRLFADKRRLKQILINLLSNAIKFTPAGGKVSAKVWARPETGFVFHISDTGIGIALKDIPTALAPFRQVDGPLDRRYEGTGLGLPLTKSLIEMHGGSLDLQSTVGLGTTVVVRFPAERMVADEPVSDAARHTA